MKIVASGSHPKLSSSFGLDREDSRSTAPHSAVFCGRVESQVKCYPAGYEYMPAVPSLGIGKASSMLHGIARFSGRKR